MGGCSSCEATAVTSLTTAKLILPDGDLREFTSPVRAAVVLQKDGGEFFICDADDMEFYGFMSEIAGDGELRPGQIYFVLPRSMLRHPLQAEDLAALASKASSALMRSAPGRGRPLVFPETTPPAPATQCSISDRRTRSRSRGTGRSFESNLSGILE
ncbi:hypothetical protein KSP40_PGU021840 [Platanthera guangdongensis]|uniref:Uncharacterized protein n=1 Tax=Platanthera guangdongensis TaxID=2320717 RepID=A0ABR2MIE5_9ASPA